MIVLPHRTVLVENSQLLGLLHSGCEVGGPGEAG